MGLRYPNGGYHAVIGAMVVVMFLLEDSHMSYDSSTFMLVPD